MSIVTGIISVDFLFLSDSSPSIFNFVCLLEDKSRVKGNTMDERQDVCEWFVCVCVCQDSWELFILKEK